MLELEEVKFPKLWIKQKEWVELPLVDLRLVLEIFHAEDVIIVLEAPMSPDQSYITTKGEPTTTYQFDTPMIRAIP